MFGKINAFWNTWEKNERSIFTMLLFLFFILLIVMGVYVFNGIHQPIEAMPLSKTESMEVSYRDLLDPVVNIPVKAYNYIVTQTAIGSAYKIQVGLSRVLLVVQLLLISLLLAAATYISRFWFMLSVAAVVFWFIGMQFDQLAVFGLESRIYTFSSIGLSVLLLYYLQAFRQDMALPWRTLCIVVVLGAIFAIAAYDSEKPAALFFLTNNMQVLPIIVTVLLAFNVGYELIFWLLYLLTKSKTVEKGHSNSMHLLVMGGIYVIYVSLTYMYRNGYIHWELIYFNEFLIFTIVSVLGIWGIQRRQVLFENQLESKAITGVLYLSMASLSVTAIIWVFATGNDPLMETFEDLISITQIAFGGMFLIYVLYNFYKPIQEGLQVHKIVFKPNKLPFFSFRFAGLIVFIAIFLRASMFPYYQAIAGYYNGLADYYRYTNHPELTRLFYRMSLGYAQNNQKANYSLGLQYMLNENDHIEGIYYFRKAKSKQASPFTYLNLAYARNKSEQIFDALFETQEGLEKFPDDGYLLNNMGYMYDKVNKRDSAYYFYDKAWNTIAGHLAAVNTLGFFTKYNYDIDTDSLLTRVWPQNAEAETNLLALANKHQIKLSKEIIDYPLDSNLSYTDFAYLHNLGVYGAMTYSGQWIEKTRSYLDKMDISPFKEPLKLNLAHQYNAAGKITQAYTLLFDLQQNDAYRAGDYHYINALFAYEQKAYDLAIEHAKEAIYFKNRAANTVLIFSHIRKGELTLAKNALLDDLYAQSIDEEAIADDPLYRLLVSNEATNAAFGYLSFLLGGKQQIPEIIRGTSFEKYAMYDLFYDALLKEKTEEAGQYLEKMKQLPALEMLDEKATILLALVAETDAAHKSSLPDYPFAWRSLSEAMQTKDLNIMKAVSKDNPFFSPLVIYTTQKMYQNGAEEEAHEFLVEAIRLHQEHPPLMKAYILMCIQMNLNTYAEDMMIRLYRLIPESEFDEFEEKYTYMRDEMKQKHEHWEN